MSKIDLVLALSPAARLAFENSPNGDFSWTPTYEDGIDYPRFADRWFLTRVSFAIKVVEGALDLQIHQIYSNGSVVKFVLDEDITERSLTKIIDDLNERCLAACCRYLAYARVTKSDPIRFISGMPTWDSDTAAMREADYLEAHLALFGTNAKFDC
jgi:hypothetical protein